MKKNALVLSLIVTVILSSCSILNKKSPSVQGYQDLSGTWVLAYITGPRITFEGLYPGQKPTAVFDIEKNELTGNTSCNSYGSTIVLDKDKIKIEKPYSTMMACEGNGESVYLSTLSKIESYKIKEDTLSFYMDDIEMMRFVKK
jgi:heat shock protein HslJ